MGDWADDLDDMRERAIAEAREAEGLKILFFALLTGE